MKKPRGRNLDEILAERRARRRGRLSAILLGSLVLAGAGALIERWLEMRRNPDFTQRRTVVLPFDNRTGDAAFDTLGLVASDWITRVLTLYAPRHEVVPTTTTLAYLQSAQLGRFDLLTRAQRLAQGTRSQLVVWGSFYRTGDSLRFNIEINDLKSSLMVGSIPQVAAHVDQPMTAIDRLRSGVVGAILHTESMNRPIRRRVPDAAAYQSFVNGLRAHINGRFAEAALSFSAARGDTSLLPYDVWLTEALVRSRQFERADSVLRAMQSRRLTDADNARAMRSYARVRSDAFNQYGWSSSLASANPADDLAAYEYALAALALNRPREARLVFREMHPNYGSLHGRPEFYLHYAAAYHLMGNHRSELGVVRDGLIARTRSIPVRLANCRVRAALGVEANAQAALDALMASDTDTTGVMPLGYALDDCAAELDAHGFPALAARAQTYARHWHRRRPAAPIAQPDSVYDKARLKYLAAAAEAARGDLAGALTSLNDALFAGLPYYEPGRVMLHADPAFRRLRHTRGLLRINQPRG